MVTMRGFDEESDPWARFIVYHQKSNEMHGGCDDDDIGNHNKFGDD